MELFFMGMAACLAVLILIATVVTRGKIWFFVWFFVLYGIAKLLGRSNPLG